MSCYVDTSVVLKLYVTESDSPEWLAWIARKQAPLYSSQLLKIELAFALSQKEKREEIRPNSAINIFQHFLSDVSRGRYSLLPLENTVFTKALELAFLTLDPEFTPLRTLDGLHLATALTHEFTHIATTDKRLMNASERVGITPVDPGD